MDDELVQDSGTNQAEPVQLVEWKMGQPMWSKNNRTWLEQNVSNHGEIAASAEQPKIAELANELGLKLNNETKDYLVEYYLDEQAQQNAFNRSMQASNTQYQRAVEDLRKAGINPFFALQSLSGSSPSSSAGGVSGGLITEARTARQKRATDTTNRIMMVLGVIAAAIIGAMAA